MTLDHRVHFETDQGKKKKKEYYPLESVNIFIIASIT